MGFIEWLGFSSKPRDAPNFRNNVRDSGTMFIFGAANSGERVDEKSALQIVTVYTCVRLLADSIAQLPLHLYRQEADNKSVKAVEHPLYKILYRQVNPEMTSFSFREVMVTHLLLWGNAYAQIIRDGRNQILGLYPLLPENVEVDRDKNGKLYYIYHAYTDEVPGKSNQDVILRREEVFHVPGLGFNGLVGFSPIAMMKNCLGLSISVDKYGGNFFKNGAQPIGVLETPTLIENHERLRQEWMDSYGGSNAHKVAILEDGMTYKPISLPPEDSQFLATREFNVEEICRIFRVPPHMVQSLKRSTFNNIEHQSIDFVVHTLDPWLIRIEQAIVKDLLLPEEQDIYYPKFNVDGQLRGDTKSRMEAYAVELINGITTVNEIRQKENLPLIPDEEGGNYHIVQSSYIRLKDIGAPYAANLNQGQIQPETSTEPDTESEPDKEESEESENEAKKQKERIKQRKGR